MQCIIDLIDREELILRIILYGMASPASVHYRHDAMQHLSHHEHRQVITTGELMHRQVRRPASAGDRHRLIIIVKSGDRQVPKTGIVIVHSPSSPETGELSLPETGTVTVAQSFIHRQVKSSCG